jgi:Uma2 family endonuclease
MSATGTAPQPAALDPTTPPPTGAGPRPWRWTREDYYRLGELGFFQGKRVELIRGEIVEMSPINRPHVQATGLTADALRRVFAAGYHICVQQPILVLGAGGVSEPEPDVSVIRGGWRDYADHPTTAALLVEVSDTTLTYDTTTKAELYATAGVADYWVLDLNARRLLVFRDPAPIPGGTQAYRTHLTFGESDSVSPLAAPNATVKVADLLP